MVMRMEANMREIVMVRFLEACRGLRAWHASKESTGTWEVLRLQQRLVGKSETRVRTPICCRKSDQFIIL